MRTNLRHLLLCVLACLSLAACDTSPPPLLRVAAHVWPGYESLYLARSMGLYDENTVRLIETATAIDSMDLMRAGSVEAAALTLDEALLLQQDGVDVKIVLVMDASHGADKLLARPGIATLKSLRGARVGVESGAVGAVMLQAALDHAQLEVSDIQVVPLRANEQLKAWNAGEIDAVVTYDPVASEIKKSGGRLVFDSSQIAGRILDVLVVRTDALKRHEAHLKTLIAGHFAALEHRARKPQAADASIAKRLRMPVSDVPALFSGIEIPDVAGNRAYLEGSSPVLESTAVDLAELMVRANLLWKHLNSGGIAVPDLLPKGQP